MAPDGYRRLMVPFDIYVRISRVGGREHLMSHDDQEREARAFALSRGLPLSGKVFEDRDKSGGTLNRAGLQEILSRVEAGESGGMIVAYQSRASRDTAQGLQMFDDITRNGGTVYAPNMSDYTTADGRMITTINLAIDTAYRERKREEFERAKKGAIEAGIPVSNRTRVGYVRNAERRLEPDPRTGPIISELFRMRARGAGPAELGDYLARENVPTSQDSHTWSKSAVYDLIGSRVYLGELSYGTPPRYVNPSAHEPLTDLATWKAAQRPGKAPLAPPRSATSPFVLTGVLRCAACRYSLHGTTTSRKERVYRCTRRHAAGMCPNPAHVKAADIEPVGLAAFWTIAEDMEARGSEDGSAAAILALENEYEAAERAYVRWRDDAEAADEDYEEHKLRLRSLRQRRDISAEALGLARAAQDPDTFPAVATLRADWPTMTPATQRQLLAARLDCIAVLRGDEGHHAIVYASGEAPGDLPRRGFKHAPTLRGFDQPSGARVLSL